MKEALLYEKLDGERVRCNLCAHRCVIAEGRKGVCLVRENREGSLHPGVWHSPSQAVDPIEKKPLFHFLPGQHGLFHRHGRLQLSLCLLPERRHLADAPRPGRRSWAARRHRRRWSRPPSATVRRSIAYTYTEPTIFFEYSYDIARLAHEAGIASVYVTNGYMTPEMLELFQGVNNGHEPWLHAANVDLKAFRDETYKKVCGARLQPVLDSLKRMKELGVWVEVTTLVVPDMNDSEEELGDIAQFIAAELGVETPWHVSRFHPDYKMHDRGPTPAEHAAPGLRAGPGGRIALRLCGQHARRPAWRTPFAPTAGRRSSGAGASRSLDAEHPGWQVRPLWHADRWRGDE